MDGNLWKYSHAARKKKGQTETTRSAFLVDLYCESLLFLTFKEHRFTINT